MEDNQTLEVPNVEKHYFVYQGFFERIYSEQEFYTYYTIITPFKCCQNPKHK